MNTKWILIFTLAVIFLFTSCKGVSESNQAAAFDSSRLVFITYAGGRFITVDYNGKTGFSDDGIHWVAAGNTALDAGVDAIAYGGERFVAVSLNGKTAHSRNGAAWAVVSSKAFGASPIYTIAYGVPDPEGSGRGRFVAGGGDAKMAYSNDGITWTATANSALDNSSWKMINAIAYGASEGGRFVAVGWNAVLSYSSDGITWNAAAVNPFHTSRNFYAVAYGVVDTPEGRVGRFVATSDSFMAYSDDGGITWAAVNTPFSSPIDAIAYGVPAGSGGGRFVATGNNGTLAYSDDGINWTAVRGAIFSSGASCSAVYGRGRFIIIAKNLNERAYSDDGRTWTAVKFHTIPAQKQVTMYVSAKGGLNIRSEPSTAGNIVRTLPYGAMVTVQQWASAAVDGIEDYWYKVWHGGNRESLTGYAFGGYLSLAR